MHSGHTGQTEVDGHVLIVAHSQQLIVLAAELKAIADRGERLIDSSWCVESPCRLVRGGVHSWTYSPLELCSPEWSRDIGIQKKHFR